MPADSAAARPRVMLRERNPALGWAKSRIFPVVARLLDRAAPLPAAFAPRRILVMQLQQIGDSVIFTPALRALRRRFPESRIDLLVNRVSRELYRKCPYVDRVHVATEWKAGPGGNRLRPLLPLLRAVRRERYDLVVSDMAQQSFKYALIARATGAPVRAGFNLAHRGFLHTLQVPFRPDVSWVESNLDVARALGATELEAREELYFDDADRAHVERLLARGGAAARPLVVMHTGANWESRTWYPERWAAVGDRLQEEMGASVVFVGTPGERAQVEAVRQRMRRPGLSLVGETDIPQLAALLAAADLFVGTDSGPRHMAGAVGTAHVVVMSSQDDTDYWVGFRERERVLRSLPPCRGCFSAVCSHKTCMDLIRVEQVFAACRELLALGAAASASAPARVPGARSA